MLDAFGLSETDLRKHTMELKQGMQEYQPSTGPAGGRPPVAEPRQIAYAHLFLVSDEASFFTGASLIADGGRIVIPA